MDKKNPGTVTYAVILKTGKQTETKILGWNKGLSADQDQRSYFKNCYLYSLIKNIIIPIYTYIQNNKIIKVKTQNDNQQ